MVVSLEPTRDQNILNQLARNRQDGTRDSAESRRWFVMQLYLQDQWPMRFIELNDVRISVEKHFQWIDSTISELTNPASPSRV